MVIGAGHAGCEAARACARMGLRTAMVTMNLDLIAQMSCNPAIGGIAKGHLVREIDALGGVMGEVADAVGIQFRLLNTSRGPAVWSPRAQMRQEAVPHAHAGDAGAASRICGSSRRKSPRCIIDGPAASRGVLLRDGRTIRRRSRGRHHRDIPQRPGARRRDSAIAAAATARRPRNCWATSCATLGLQWTRLKTGTPPRLDGRTIDWSQFEPQPGDAEPDAVLVPDGTDRPAADPVPHRVHHRGDPAGPAGGDSALSFI